MENGCLNTCTGYCTKPWSEDFKQVCVCAHLMTYGDSNSPQFWLLNNVFIEFIKGLIPLCSRITPATDVRQTYFYNEVYKKGQRNHKHNKCRHLLHFVDISTLYGQFDSPLFVSDRQRLNIFCLCLARRDSRGVHVDNASFRWKKVNVKCRKT